jgi:hypothetical protein
MPYFMCEMFTHTVFSNFGGPSVLFFSGSCVKVLCVSPEISVLVTF